MKRFWLLTGLGLALMFQGCTTYGYGPGYGYGGGYGYGPGYRPWYSGWRNPAYRYPPVVVVRPPPVLPRAYHDRRGGHKPLPHWNRRPWVGGHGAGFAAGRQGHGADSRGIGRGHSTMGRRHGDGPGYTGGKPVGGVIGRRNEHDRAIGGGGRRSGYVAMRDSAHESGGRRGPDGGFSGASGHRGRRR